MKQSFTKYLFLTAIFGILLFNGFPIPVASVSASKADFSTIKAGFIYVGPVGDLGWTYAHDEGRNITENKFSDWLTTYTIGPIEETPTAVTDAVDTLVAQHGVNVIFTTSFGFMDGTVEAAAQYPDKIFFHNSGYKRSANLGTYFADFYPIYYLNGLMAGALTESDKLGYVGAHPVAEVIRHINAFALGANEVNPNATVDVRWINAWFDPVKAETAAKALIADGVDMLAFTEDSASVVQVAEETSGVYAFSHYSPMQDTFGPTSTISGQLIHWDILYSDILNAIHNGTYTNTNLANVDLLYFFKEGAIELGGEFGKPINAPFVNDLKAVEVNDTSLGTISVYDLIFERIDQMNKTWADWDFDPFTGPIKAQNGTTMYASGVRASIPDLFSTMNWFVDNVTGTIPSGGSSPADFFSFGLALIFVAIFYSRKKK
jgi:simple sugar transport system substrate-binding protein